jgi:DNA-binding transcriptional LysR family regulator
MKITLEELLAFRTVVDTGSITAAAESLGQTVSGISRALSRLEEKLETTLLNRTTRRLVLTEEGIAFLNHARGILASVDEAEDQIAIRRQKPAGRLRVNAATPFMLHVIVPFVAEFRELYPEIELELNTDDILIDLLAQDTDIAIRIGTLRDSTLHARALPVSQRSILASPGYLEKFGVPQTTEDLSNHCLIGFNQPEHLNQWPIRHTHGDSWQITPSIRASSGETVRQLALAGVGLVCISDFMTLADQQRGELVQVLKKETFLVRQPINAVYYRNTQLSARIVCFLDFLIERMSRNIEK